VQLPLEHRRSSQTMQTSGIPQGWPWKVSKNTVAAIMREQGLAARSKQRRRATTRPGKGRWRAPDLVKRDFPARQVNRKWYGDDTEIPTSEGKLYLDGDGHGLRSCRDCLLSGRPRVACLPQDGEGECGAISINRVPKVTEVSRAGLEGSGTHV
jgi:transposase InsO family protein